MSNDSKTTALARSDALGGRELATTAETATSATTALVRAQVESRYKMALARPRDHDDVRQRMLAECKRPHFAEIAMYSIPRGGQKIVGPSIRFAEAAMRWMTNVLPETTILYDDAQKRIVQVSVTDLEANLTYTHQIVIEKTIERKQVKSGQVALAQRTNSFGDTVYIVEATEDDLLTKQNALVSKAMRTLALRLLPGDLHDEALEQIKATYLLGENAIDPAEDRKKLADAFAGLGVAPSALKEYLGCDLGAASPAQRKDLRGLFTAIRDGHTTWFDVMLEKNDGVVTPKPTQAERLRGVPVDTKAAQQAPAQASPTTQAATEPAAAAQTVATAPHTPTVRRGARGVPVEARAPAEPPKQATEATADREPTEDEYNGRMP